MLTGIINFPVEYCARTGAVNLLAAHKEKLVRFTNEVFNEFSAERLIIATKRTVNGQDGKGPL